MDICFLQSVQVNFTIGENISIASPIIFLLSVVMLTYWITTPKLRAKRVKPIELTDKKK